MSKSIRISDKAYKLLSELRIGFETPSDAIDRICELHKRTSGFPIWDGSCASISCNGTEVIEKFNEQFGYIRVCSKCSRVHKIGNKQ